MIPRVCCRYLQILFANCCDFLQFFASLHIAGNFQIFSNIFVKGIRKNLNTCRPHFHFWYVHFLICPCLICPFLIMSISFICGFRVCMCFGLPGWGRPSSVRPPPRCRRHVLVPIFPFWKLKVWTGSCFLHLCKHWQLTNALCTCNWIWFKIPDMASACWMFEYVVFLCRGLWNL